MCDKVLISIIQLASNASFEMDPSTSGRAGDNGNIDIREVNSVGYEVDPINTRIPGNDYVPVCEDEFSYSVMELDGRYVLTQESGQKPLLLPQARFLDEPLPERPLDRGCLGWLIPDLASSQQLPIELGIFHCLGVDVHASKYPLVKSCYWELPRIGEIKINTNGAAKRNPGKGGIGCIYRDCNGNVLGTLAKGLGLVSNFMAECEAIIHGVEYVASFGWLIAWIESDSTTAVEAFKTNNIPWTLVAAWENASRNMRNIRFSANWREANFDANTLSKKGALLHEGVSMYVMGRPDFLKKIKVPMQEYFRLC
ncbi:hypothetical protein GIB67_042601 [Kingdonia uniflora]|uniref:RNase H type-1 domain-containing protein n=1 Tax=Kingdonia uniflora TaxID=39325 RepID=A0A7J7M1C3_9MAGN|nr:hypothetical protein GIB67_042601 [Kingdonia uniflora]